MGRIEKALHKLWAYLVEGKAIRETWKKIWTGFWRELDRIIGILAREALKLKTPVVKNKVLFHTQENRYACNQKYICEELLRQGLDVDIVWRGPKKGTGGIPDAVRTVRAGTFNYYKELFSAGVVITNSVLFVDQPVYLKRKQVLIETWHGSLGIKNFGKFDYKGNWRWIQGAFATGRMTDYCVTNSRFVSWSLGNTYWPKTPKLEYGHPRNDLFFDTNRERREALRAELCRQWELEPDCKFLLYGPTFRDAKNFDCYDIDFDRLFGAVKERFGGEHWCLLLRYHPSLVSVYKERGFQLEETKGNGAYQIRNVTEHIDMQELIAISDVAISDYSSWIFDFMLLRRPGFIFATDIALYNNERGFNYPLETTPFPIAVNNDELMENVQNFDNERYLERLEAFLNDKGCVEDGHASERVVELIKRIISEGKKSVQKSI